MIIHPAFNQFSMDHQLQSWGLMLDLVGNSQYTCDSDIIHGGNDYIIRFVNNAVVMTTLSNDVLINKYEVAQGASIMIIDGTCIEITTKGMRRIFMFRFFGRINAMLSTCVASEWIAG